VLLLLLPVRCAVQAVVIAAALSMSSSAFVLQLLSERGESATKVGSATLGILLFQVRAHKQRQQQCTHVQWAQHLR
jgi:Kef-type K+ transport system membrane component KefB